MNEKYTIHFSSLDWIEPALGVRFKSILKDDKKLRLVEFTEEFIEENWCTKGHIGFIVEGEMEINFNGVINKFNAGDALFIPEGENHRHKHHSTGQRVKLFLVEET